MAHLDCTICLAHCCGESPICAPIVFPFEEDQFKGELVTDPKLPLIKWLRRKEDGTCIHLRDRRCQIYERRPTECHLYPWYLSAKTGTPKLIPTAYCAQVSAVPCPAVPSAVQAISADYWPQYDAAQE